MKNLSKIFALGAAIASVLACSKSENAPETLGVKTGRQMTIIAGTESKSIMRAGGAVHWVSDDKLVVFDDEYSGVVFSNDPDAAASATAVFTSDSWTGKTPVLAVHSGDATQLPSHSYDGSKVTAYLNPIQKISNKASYAKAASLSIGQISLNEGQYQVGQMKNCFALLRFTVSEQSISTIVMKGNNNETLAGWADVSYNSGEPTWAVNPSKTGADEIKLGAAGSASENGAFIPNTNYCIAVYPQTLANGFSLELTKSDGTVATRNISSSVVLQRSKIKEFSAPIDQNLEWKSGDIVLDCTNAGNFRYGEGDGTALPNRGSTVETDFWLIGYKDYLFHGTVARWSSNNLNAAAKSPVKLPTIAGFTLTEVNITYAYHTDERTYSITDGTNTILGDPVRRMRATTGETKIDLSAAVSDSPDRYLVCSGEMGVKFILTYTPNGSE